jgi:hypothetical protein
VIAAAAAGDANPWAPSGAVAEVLLAVFAAGVLLFMGAVVSPAKAAGNRHAIGASFVYYVLMQAVCNKHLLVCFVQRNMSQPENRLPCILR